MLSQIQNVVDFSQPKRSGNRMVRTASPTQGFWELWKLNKDGIKAWGISVSKPDGKWLITWWLPEERERYELSKDSLEILYDYQREHTRILAEGVNCGQGALDSSNTGAGKTVIGLVIAKDLGLKPFVICPLNVVSIWEKWAKYVGVEVEAVNYARARLGNEKIIRTEVSNEGNKTISYKFKLPNDTLIIFDEAHRCKSYKTLNSKLMETASKNFKVMCLSATIADNPLQMRSVGKAIGLFRTNKEFWEFAKNHGVKKGLYGYEFKGTDDHLRRISNLLYPRYGSRILTSEVEGFPETQIIPEAYTMGEADEIRIAYEIMKSELEKLDAKSYEDGESHLTIMLRARQRVELLKVPTFVSMTRDMVEEGNSVVIFVNFTESLKSLADLLKTNCLIYGEQTIEERSENIERFNSDRERIIIANIQAGGVGISLHDLNGDFPRVSLISPTWSAQDLVQALGRIHRAGGKTKSIQRIIYCAGTVEEEVCERVREKIDRINLLNDGDLGLDFS